MLEDEIVVHNQYGSLLRDIGHYGSPAVQPDKSQNFVYCLSFYEARHLMMKTVALEIQLFIEDSRSGTVVGLEQLNQKIVSKMGPLGLEKARAYTALKDYGWTITTGLKYGADFLLYRGNPEEFHAEFCVVIREVDPQWREIVSLNRVASASKKSLLLVLCSSERMDYYVFKRFQPDEERITRHR